MTWPSRSEGGCRVCGGFEPHTVDRLLLAGHGIRFVADRWGHTRQVVKRHRDRCLTGARLKATQAALDRMRGGAVPNG
jgi:hypothetical protein